MNIKNIFPHHQKIVMGKFNWELNVRMNGEEERKTRHVKAFWLLLKYKSTKICEVLKFYVNFWRMSAVLGVVKWFKRWCDLMKSLKRILRIIGVLGEIYQCGEAKSIKLIKKDAYHD